MGKLVATFPARGEFDRAGAGLDRPSKTAVPAEPPVTFAVGVYMGLAAVTKCRPVFGGPFAHLRDALAEVCAAVGASDEAVSTHPV